jgi:hypothetical protein
MHKNLNAPSRSTSDCTHTHAPDKQSTGAPCDLVAMLVNRARSTKICTVIFATSVGVVLLCIHSALDAVSSLTKGQKLHCRRSCARFGFSIDGRWPSDAPARA